MIRMMLTRLIGPGVNSNTQAIISQSQRPKSMFVKLPASKLWDSTAPAVVRRGRGKRAKVRKREDLGRNKNFGEGAAGMMWPGLNTSVKSQQYQRTEEEQEAFLKKLEEREKLRTMPQREKVMGWTGAQWGGVYLSEIGQVDGVSFDDFKSVILGVMRVAHMTGRQGRVYGVKSIVGVGNGNGVIGISTATSTDISSSVRKARLKALKRLQCVERFDERTMFEDIYVNFHHTKMYMRPQPVGYGLRCHRAVADMCKLVGIKDLYVKTYGAKTMTNLTKCFVKGLLMQESHQSKADRTGYNVVSYDEERGGYPTVLASPSSGRTKQEQFDEMTAYLNQDILLREFRNMEGLRDNSWSLNQITNNRGLPVPPNFELPDAIKSIRNSRL